MLNYSNGHRLIGGASDKANFKPGAIFTLAALIAGFAYYTLHHDAVAGPPSVVPTFVHRGVVVHYETAGGNYVMKPLACPSTTVSWINTSLALNATLDAKVLCGNTTYPTYEVTVGGGTDHYYLAPTQSAANGGPVNGYVAYFDMTTGHTVPAVLFEPAGD